MWNPQNPSVGDKVARAIVYFVALIYMFLGMSIIADRFMSSIEVCDLSLASLERGQCPAAFPAPPFTAVLLLFPGHNLPGKGNHHKEAQRRNHDGDRQDLERDRLQPHPHGSGFQRPRDPAVRHRGECVGFAGAGARGAGGSDLGSSAQVCGHDFQAGALGPSTIVGSAAFNMFVIIAICVYVVPDGETRKIKHLRVFFVTAAWSIFAYIWLYLILSVFSPGEVAVRTG